MDTDTAAEWCALRWDIPFEMGRHDLLQGISADEAPVERPFGHLQIGIRESEAPMKLAALVDPADPIFAEWRFVVTTLFVETRATASDCDVIKRLDDPILRHDMQAV